MKNVLLGVLLIAIPVGGPFLLASAIPSAPLSVDGKYGCIGQGPDGKSYEVDLEVEKRNDGYGLTWSVAGETTGIGIGFVKGDVLTAIFQTAKAVGIVAFSVSKNSLDGTWTVPQLDGVLLPEKCSIGSGPAKAV